MRRSREAAAATRAKIVKVASRQFRKHGIAGVGVADIMAKAELTHGGFYKHFPSKEALAAEACKLALERRREELVELVRTAPKGRSLDAIVSAYLSPLHLEHVERGCVLAALANDAPRLGGAVREALADGFEALSRLVAEQLDARLKEAERLGRARGIVACMVGTLAMARLAPDRGDGNAILGRVRAMILDGQKH